MEYQIRALSEKDIKENLKSLLDTLENLKPKWEMSVEEWLEIMEHIKWNWEIFVAVKDDGEIVWAITMTIEYKFIRGWVKAGRVEDFAVKESTQWQGVWTALMNKALEYAKNHGVYKITLTCKEHLVPFYERFAFEKYSIQMKQYIKK